MSQVIQVTEENFQTEVLNASEPVLVDFHATWCGPCRMLEPVLETLATEYAGRIRFAKVDVDQAPRLAADSRVASVPTLSLFHGGQIRDQMIGFQSPESLRQKLDAIATQAVTAA